MAATNSNSDSIMHRADGLDSTSQVVKDPFFQIGDDVTVEAFPFEREVVEIDASTKLEKALQILAKANILSAPVYDSNNKKYLGFIDVHDLMSVTYGVDVLLSILPQSMLQKRANASANEVTVGSLFDNDSEKGESGAGKSSSSDSPDVTLWYPVSPTAPLKQVLALLATKCRRVPVQDPKTGKCVKIISQSAVVHELYKHIQSAGDKAPAVLMQTPRSSGIGTKKVVSVQDDQPVRLAFEAMLENGISAVAVTDDEGKLFTCVSTKDIRALPNLNSLASGNSMLNLSAREFVQHIRLSSEKDGKARPSIISASLDTPIKTILGKLAETKLHRIFLMDENGKPAGVVSASDIVTLLCMEQNWS